MGPTSQGNMSREEPHHVRVQDRLPCAQGTLTAFTENAGLFSPPRPQKHSCHPFPCPQERCWAAFGIRVYLEQVQEVLQAGAGEAK